MSDIDRRELYKEIWLQDGPEFPGEGYADTSYGDTTWCQDRINNSDTHYHHESAVRELVKALQDMKLAAIHLYMTEDDTDYFTAKDASNDLLAHYKELLDE